MVERLLRTVSVGSSLLVLASFALFALDRFGSASARQQASIAETGGLTRPEPRASAQPRRFVDGSARALLSPFAGLETTGGAWGRRTVPTLLALLVYGFGLSVLARSARGLP